jgi:TonB family protein
LPGLLAVGALAAVEVAPTPAGGKVVPPVAVRRVVPVHPPELQKELINGDVTLECLVDTEGMTHDVKVISSSHTGFIAAAKEALEQWQFTPGTVDGKLAPVRVRVTFEFKLSPEQVMTAIAGRPVFMEVKEEIIPASQLPSWPRPLQFYVPRYPAELEGTGKYGKAVVNITIDKQGKVINPRLVKATYPEFVIPSLITALKLQFPPQVMANNLKIYVNMEIQFDFKVPDRPLVGKGRDDKAKADAAAKKAGDKKN